MKSIRFGYARFGIVVAACSAAVVACSSGTSSPADTGGGTGGSFTGAGGGVTGGGVTGGGVTGGGVTGGGVTGGGVTGGGVTGNGGASGGGGAKPGGGGTSVGGATMTGNLTIVGSVTKCTDTPAAPPSTTVNACNITGCTNAHCVADANVPASFTDKTLLAKCGDGTYCIPDDYIVTSGKFLPKTCTSLVGAEGRCISKCIPQVNVQLTTLPKDVCADTELCAPCFNPIDGADTKACNEGCDTGPVNKTPVVFTPCGAGLGVCVPPALVTDPGQKAALNKVDDPTGKPGTACTQKDAAGAFYLCAPIEKAKNQAYNFPVCHSDSLAAAFGTITNSTGQTGGCVPAYLVPSAKQSLVAVNDCTGTGVKCAPCTDPTVTGNPASGACPP
jgi:hypothetical protein